MNATDTTEAQTPAKTASNSPARQFRRMASQIAKSMLTDWVGEERAQEATGRISAALAASAASARNPQDFYACTVDSIGRCVAIAALTEIMPGVGSTALAYLIPRRPRKNEQPQLNYQLSHRGLNALARRTGQTMIAIPIGKNDSLQVEQDGDVRVIDRDIDNPPTSDADLRGVIVVIRELSSGNTIFRGFVPVSLINKRRDTSDSYKFALRTEWARATDPWHVWYVEMAMKTAMHYAIGRGWCVIDDNAASKAMSVEQAQDVSVVRPAVIEVDASESKSERIADELEERALAGSDAVNDAPEMSHDESVAEPPGDAHNEPESLPPSERYEELKVLIDSKRVKNTLLEAKQELLAAKNFLSQDEYDDLDELIAARLQVVK